MDSSLLADLTSTQPFPNAEKTIHDFLEQSPETCRVFVESKPRSLTARNPDQRSRFEDEINVADVFIEHDQDGLPHARRRRCCCSAGKRDGQQKE